MVVADHPGRPGDGRPFSIDTIFPAFAQLAVDLDTSPLALQQLISVYLLSFAAMSLFHGPLSDALGHKPVILAGSALFVLSSLACALAPNLAWLLVGRAAQGNRAGAGQIISQRWCGTSSRRPGAADDGADRDDLRARSGAGPDRRRLAAGARRLAGDLLVPDRARHPCCCCWSGSSCRAHPVADRTPLEIRSLFRSLWEVWRDRNGRRLALAAAVNFAGMFLYISSAPMFVVNLLGMGEQDFWVLFVPLISGMVIGSWTSGRLARADQRAPAGHHRLLGEPRRWRAEPGGATMLIPTAQTAPWAVLLLPVYTFGVALAFPILTLAMLDLFPANRGAASSVQSFVSLVSNAIIAGALAPAVAFSLPMLAGTTLVLTVIGYLMWRRHLQMTSLEPHVPPDPQSYEPTDEM